MDRRDLVVGASLCGLVALWAPVVLEAQDRGATRIRCSNNLRQLGLGAIQYADDKRFYPHVRGLRELDGDVHSADTPRVARTLLFFGYLDDPAVFVCPESRDAVAPFAAEAVDDVRRWSWGGAAQDDVQTSPLVAGDDPPLAKTTELSYGWTRRAHNANARSTTVLMADRAARAAPDARGPLAGNHPDGWNVLQADASVRWLGLDADPFPGTWLPATAQATDGHLAVLPQPDRSAFSGAAAASLSPAQAAAWAGVFTDGRVRLELTATTWGFRGQLRAGERALRVTAEPRPGTTDLQGQASSGSEERAFSAVREGDLAVIRVGDEVHRLERDPTPRLVLGLLEAALRGDREAVLGALAPQDRELIAKAGLEDRLMEALARKAREAVKEATEDLGDGFQRQPDGSWKLALLDERERRQLRGDAEPVDPTASAISALRTLAVAQTLFREGDRDGDGVLDYAASLAELGQAQLIDEALASGTKHGYRFEVRRSSEHPEFMWAATASPVEPGGRSLFTNHSGVIWWAPDGPRPLDDRCEPPPGASPVAR